MHPNPSLCATCLLLLASSLAWWVRAQLHRRFASCHWVIQSPMVTQCLGVIVFRYINCSRTPVTVWISPERRPGMERLTCLTRTMKDTLDGQFAESTPLRLTCWP